MYHRHKLLDFIFIISFEKVKWLIFFSTNHINILKDWHLAIEPQLKRVCYTEKNNKFKQALL
jgi:hypothetical protein